MKEWIRDIGVAVCAVLLTLQFVQTARVSGVSMQPNFQPNDLLFLSTQSYNNRDPKRGQVVIFRSALKDQNGKKELLIKRIIGVPGDTVIIRNGRVRVNGKEQKSDYTKDLTTNGDITVLVPKDSYFVMGDNRLHSVDSRFSDVGFVRRESIRGRVVFRILPVNRIGRTLDTGERR